MFNDDELNVLGPTLAKIIYAGLIQFREKNFRTADDEEELEKFDNMADAIKLVAGDVDIDNLSIIDRQRYDKGMKYFVKTFHTLWL